MALVQTRASLIAGDDIALSVSVSAGAALEIVELGATLAHDSRGGAGAQVRVTIEVGEGGRLIWEGKPLIAGAGCRVLRVTDAHVSPGGRLLLGESVVLGRAGQTPGELTTRFTISCGRTPTVIETLETGDQAVFTSAVVAGSARMVVGLTLAGLRDPEPPAGVMQAHGPASLWREATDSIHGAAAAACLSSRWRRLLLEGRGSAAQPDLATPTLSELANTAA